MEFSNRGEFARIVVTDKEPLISQGELSLITRNSYLHDISSFFIIEKNGTYRDDEKFDYSTALYRAIKIEQAFKQGHTILVKNLEKWNQAIVDKCNELGGDINVHLYASPAAGSGFGWHSDDRDVYVYLQFGSKKFEVRQPDGVEQSFLLTPGSCLYIPYGVKHRGISENVDSLHLSFGRWPSQMTIRETYSAIESEGFFKETF